MVDMGSCLVVLSSQKFEPITFELWSATGKRLWKRNKRRVEEMGRNLGIVRCFNTI